MLLTGYKLTVFVDQGDYWLNAVDRREYTTIVHKECAWNDDLLNPLSDVTEMQPIKPDETSGLTCDICKKPLTEQAYFSFQAEAVSFRLCNCSQCRWKRAQAHDQQNKT